MAVAIILCVGFTSSYAAKTEKDLGYEQISNDLVAPVKVLAQAEGIQSGDTPVTVKETPVYSVEKSGSTDSVEVTVEQLAQQGIKLIGEYPGSGANAGQWVSWAGNILQFIVAVVLYFLYRKEKKKNE